MSVLSNKSLAWQKPCGVYDLFPRTRPAILSARHQLEQADCDNMWPDLRWLMFPTASSTIVDVWQGLEDKMSAIKLWVILMLILDWWWWHRALILLGVTWPHCLVVPITTPSTMHVNIPICSPPPPMQAILSARIEFKHFSSVWFQTTNPELIQQ